jgi:hypothetical protein
MALTFGKSTQLARLAATCLLAACGIFGSDDSSLGANERGLAILAFYGDTSDVQLAATVRVGEVTSVRFTSFGGGCIRQDSTEVVVSGLTADIRPHRLEGPPNAVCTANLRIDQNGADLRFGEPGRARVRIVGLAQPGDRLFVLERGLLVNP